MSIAHSVDGGVTVTLDYAPDEQLHFQTISALLLGPLAAVLIWFLPLGLEPTVQKVFAIVAFMVIYWITEPVEHAVAALIGCYLFWALGIVKPSVAFSGFATTTPWFLLGAMLMGEAASSTGLAKRLGYMVMVRIGTSYSQLALGVVTLGFILNFLIPSGMARLTVMAPLVIGIVAAFGVGRGSRIGKGLFLILTYTCALFDRMILSGAASILTRGIIADQGQIQVNWSQWFFAFLPASAIVLLISWKTVQWLYPPEKSELPGGKSYLQESLEKMGRWNRKEKRALIWLLAAIVLWATDFIHNIDPAVITLGIGLFLFLPKLGVLESKALKQVNFATILFSAGALTMANVLSQTHALDILTQHMFGWVEPLLGSPVLSALVLYWSAFFYHFLLANDQSMLSTSLPPLLQFALNQGYNPVSIGLLWSFATGARIFVYQSSVLVLGYSYGYFQCRDVIKEGFLMSLVQALIVVLLVGFYWPLIGLNWMK